MPLVPGTRLGPYQIEAVLGAGGMGEVYQARDVRLDRTVAIKVLPSAIASDPESRHRFEREAKAIAALSHPHICTLYDVGEEANPGSEGPERVRFLIMERLEGETLDVALKGKRLPLDRVIRIGIQSADALDRAHRTGIVHRDLKPGNIMLTPRGAVLLDFGLARTLPAAPVSGMTIGATMTGPLTGRGTILGTLHYMAPEQVEGKDADARSDIFSLGTILYEMAMGRRAFEGNSAAGVMAAILEREPPPLSARQPPVPALFEHIVARCLAKDPNERWQSAGDLMRELTWLAQTAATSTQPLSARSPRRWPERTAWIFTLVVLTAIAVLATTMMVARRSAAALQEMRLDLAMPPTIDPFSIAISPDGLKVVFLGDDSGRPGLWLRRLDTGSTQRLNGTDNSHLPFWSPDSRSIGFAASGQLKRIDLESGSVQKLANAPLFLGGAWSRDGQILFVPNTGSRVFRIDADTPGQPVAVTPVINLANQSAPHIVAGTDRFLFYVGGNSESRARGIYVSKMDGTDVRQLLEADSPAVHARSGHLLFVLRGALVARRFDSGRAELTGEPLQVADGIMTGVFAGSQVVPLSISDTGRLVYRLGGADRLRFQLRWVHRSGTPIVPVTVESPVLLNLVLSPDERRASVFTGGRGTDISLVDLISGDLTQFTSDPSVDFAGVWSPDGSRLVFSSKRQDAYDLYQKHTTGAGGETLLLTTPQDKTPTDWSRDGKFLLYRALDPRTSFDVWALPMAGGKEFPVLATENEERDAQFSPNGRWITYQSNETGRFEINVRPFRVPGTAVETTEKWTISKDGGVQPRWGHSGTELFYVGLDGRLMAVPVRETADGGFEQGTPVALTVPAVPLVFGGGTASPSYAVPKDASRFLMTMLPLSPTSSPITVLLNWRPAP